MIASFRLMRMINLWAVMIIGIPSIRAFSQSSSFISSKGYHPYSPSSFFETSTSRVRSTRIYAADAAAPPDTMLEKMTVPQLKQLLKDNNLQERGLLTRLKKKQDLIDYLKEHMQVDRLESEIKGQVEEEKEEKGKVDDVSVSMDNGLDDEPFNFDNVDNDSDGDGDGGIDVYEEQTFEEFQERLEALKFLSPYEIDAADRAQAVFDEMLEACMFGNEDLFPNVTIYNLLLDCYAWTNDKRGASMAQLILERMQDDTVENIARPDVYSYVKVMESWSKRKQPQKAEHVFEMLQARYQENQDPSVEPNTGAYNKLIKAWMMFGTEKGAEKAEQLLREMLDQYQKHDNTCVKPNIKTWVQVMKCYTQVLNTKKVQGLFDEMKSMSEVDEPAWKPETQSYNALIRAVANNKSIPDRASRAEKILYEMIEGAKSGTNTRARPNAATFINAIYANQGSSDLSAAAKAEKLFELQEGMCKLEGNHYMKPDVRGYNAVIRVIGQTRDQQKAEKVQRILHRMKELSQKIKDIAPNTKTYNGVLQACAFTSERGNPEQLLSVFRIAVEAINDLRDSRTVKPDSSSYGLFLKSCARLMPENSQKRDSVVENVFGKCSDDGLVNEFVLDALEQAASESLFQGIIGGELDEGVELPMEWSRNVRRSKFR